VLSGFFAFLYDAIPVLIQCSPNFFRTDKKYFASYHNHQIAARQPVLCSAEAFSKQAFEPVSCYRCGYLLTRYRKPESRTFAPFFTYQDRYAVVSTSKIVFKNLLKFESTR